MTDADEAFEAVARSLPTSDGDLEELLARATHVARNAICITDADLDEPGPRIVYVNPAFERITGYRSEEVVGRNPRFLQGPATDRAVIARLRADLEAGRPFQGETANYRKDGEQFHMSWRIAAVRGADGRVTHYVAAQEDITALRAAEQRLRDEATYQEQASDWLGHLVTLAVTLARASSPDEVLALVAATAVGSLGADRAAVVLVDDERAQWLVAAVAGEGAAVAGSRFSPEAGTLVADALEGATPRLWATPARLVGAGLDDDDAGAVAVLPLGDDEPYGVLALTFPPGHRFRVAEESHLGLLARLTTLTHRKTQALDAQSSVASELQAALLPSLGALPGLELAWQYLAVADHSVVGGDWYDAVELPGGRVALFVGDVVGHGPRAAALMGEVRFTTRAGAGLRRARPAPGRARCVAAHRPRPGPGDGHALRRGGGARRHAPLQLRRPPPPGGAPRRRHRRRAQGRAVPPARRQRRWRGPLDRHRPPPAGRLPGGLQRRRLRAPRHRLRRRVPRPARPTAGHQPQPSSALRRDHRRSPRRRRRGTVPGRRRGARRPLGGVVTTAGAERSTTFPPEAERLAGVRDFAQEAAAELQLQVDADVLAVVVGELAANAVRHQDGEATLTIRRLDGGVLEVEVCDEAPGLPELAEQDPWRLGGHRGIALVAALASEWGVEVLGPGKRVWARLGPAVPPIG
ncbi:PAS domain S-box protein [Aquihabitans sp. G128]|nr:PAS domain S-box protein [Aquihabitans sp. G128]QXC63016.1 PAS domain S-box protein [Aquihabitans sp. G128]